MASPSELSLDCKPHSYSMLLKSFGDQPSDQSQKLEETLSRLEEERLKIDAFKRELPLCMQLLTNGILYTPSSHQYHMLCCLHALVKICAKSCTPSGCFLDHRMLIFMLIVY